MSWQTEPLDLEFLCSRLCPPDAAPRNLGLRMGRQPNGQILICVDVDRSTAALARLEARLGALPRTLTARSGSGTGAHLIYLFPAAHGLPRNATGLERDSVGAVDVRGEGGQIVVAPSVHESGGRYAWVDVREPVELPEAWAREFGGERALGEGLDLATEPRCPRDLDAAVHAIAPLIAVPGARHSRTLALSGLLLRGKMPVAQAVEIVALCASVAGHTDVQDRVNGVYDTARKLASGGAASGRGVFAEFAGSELTDWIVAALDLEYDPEFAPLDNFAAWLRVDREAAPEVKAPDFLAQDPIAASTLRKLAERLKRSKKRGELGDSERLLGERLVNALESDRFPAAIWTELARGLAAYFPLGHAETLASYFAGLRGEQNAESAVSFVVALGSAQRSLHDQRCADAAGRGGVVLATTDKGIAQCTLDNVCRVFESHPTFATTICWDEMRGRVIARSVLPWARSDEAWTDTDTSSATLWLQRVFGLLVSSPLVHEAVELTARKNRVHPVREYLDGLTWDGLPRLATWLSCAFGAEQSEYVARVGCAWLISAVARISRPGCEAQHMLVLEGPQGIGKSRGLKALANGWYSDTPIDLLSDNRFRQIQGIWIYEISELASFRGKQAEGIKAFVSSPTDNFCNKYDKISREIPRQVVFAGTTNKTAYLADETGARRFWPVSCVSGDVAWISENRDQLWAEAAARFTSGESWWLSDESDAQIEQEDRRERDPWEDALGVFLATRDAEGVSVAACAQFLVPGSENQTGHTYARIAAALHSIGYRRSPRTRIAGIVAPRLWYKS